MARTGWSQRSVVARTRPDEPAPDAIANDPETNVIAFRGPVVAEPEEPAVAVARIYDQEHLALYAFIRGAVRDATIAEDILHDAFVRLIREVGDGRWPINIRPWLYRVAANLIVTAGRRRRVAERHSHEFAGTPIERSPEEALVEHERDEALHAAVDALPAEPRLAILLAAHGWAGREIAEVLHKSEPAVRTMLCRARIRLREQAALAQADR